MLRNQPTLGQSGRFNELQVPKRGLDDPRLSLDTWVHVETVQDEKNLRALKLINSGLELEYRRLSGSVEGDPEATRRPRLSVAQGVLAILKENTSGTSVSAYGLDYLTYLLRAEGKNALGIQNFAGKLKERIESRWLLSFDEDKQAPGTSGSVELCFLLSAWQAQLALVNLSDRLKIPRLMQLSRLLEPQDSDEIGPEVLPFQERLKDAISLLSDQTIRVLCRQVSPLSNNARNTAALRGFLENPDDINRRRAEMTARVLQDVSTVLKMPEPLRDAVRHLRIQALKSLDDQRIRELATAGEGLKGLRKVLTDGPSSKATIALCAEVVWRGMTDLLEAQKQELNSIPQRDKGVTDAPMWSEKLTILLEKPYMLPLLATTTQGIEPHIVVCIPAATE